MKEWFDEGKRVGSYLHMYAGDLQTLTSRVDELEGLLPLKRVEVEKKEQDGKVVMTVRLIGAGFSRESTACTEQFLHGVLSEYPYKILSSRVFEGMIEVTAEEARPR